MQVNKTVGYRNKCVLRSGNTQNTQFHVFSIDKF